MLCNTMYAMQFSRYFSRICHVVVAVVAVGIDWRGNAGGNSAAGGGRGGVELLLNIAAVNRAQMHSCESTTFA
jgi:hypothetical protein